MLISLDRVTFSYAGDPILEEVSFSLHEGERVGLIGGNGEGKTTILRLITGQLIPDSGNIFRKNGLRIEYFEQTGGLESEATVYGAMEEVFREDRELIDRLRMRENALSHADGAELARLSDEIERLNRRIAARDSYHYDVRIKTVLNGMGFERVYDQIVSTMSGGEKTRLKLCRLLLEAPDLLILDEATNHLDLKTIFWLEDYLLSYKGALLIVSHDRYFLDKLTARTLELERKRVTSFKGNYSKARVLKEEKYRHDLSEYEKQQEEIARLQDYVDRNIVRATTAKSALSRVNKLERMELLEKPMPPREPPRFSFTFRDRPYERVIDIPSFDLYAEDRLLLKDASFTLMRGEKCALTGDNGTGKTTLLRFILSGDARVQLGKFVRIAYYDQENRSLSGEDRTLDAFWGQYPLMPQTEARGLLARAGLDEEDVQKKVKELSGGQRAKLQLAVLEAKHGNVLLLDEATNHLDLPAREALEEALRAFEGTILFVSHDRRFVQSVANRIVHIEDGQLHSFSGSYDEFLAARTTKPAAPANWQQPARTGNPSHRSREARAEDARRKERVRTIERRLQELEQEEAALNEELIRVAADYLRVREISDRLNEVRSESDALYEEYETLI